METNKDKSSKELKNVKKCKNIFCFSFHVIKSIISSNFQIESLILVYLSRQKAALNFYSTAQKIVGCTKSKNYIYPVNNGKFKFVKTL